MSGPGELRGTGFHQAVPEGGVNRIPEFDPRSGAHFWNMLCGFRVSDPAAIDKGTKQLILDTENLVVTTPIGCYYCEQVWTKTIGHRRCPGKPAQ